MEAAARIICGDAIKVLKTLPAGHVALTVTSPPYFRHRDYGISGQIGQEATLEEYLDRIGAILAELLRVTDQIGTCFFIVGDTYRNRKLLLVPHRIALLAGDVGWTVRNDIIWSKADPAPESPKNRWRSGHEHIVFMAKCASGYRFNADAVRVPYSASTLQRWGGGQSYGGSKSGSRRNENDSRMRDGQIFMLNPRGCLPTDVWRLPSSNTSAQHYATFPEQLIRPIIEACSNPGELVLDPFSGSGTTCRVAITLGRQALGIDLNPVYVAMAEKRPST
jgi:DNA modification methylase